MKNSGTSDKKSLPRVAVIMGSKSDWTTMSQACNALDALEVSYHVEVISAHRTPHKLMEFASTARQSGLEVIVAGAGGAAHLPGMIAASTSLPVLGVPVESKMLKGMDSLLSIVQMPKGIAVGALAIGEGGAFNAGLMAGQIVALSDASLAQRIDRWRATQTRAVLDHPDPRE